MRQLGNDRAMATSSTVSFHTTTPVSSLMGKCTVIKL